MPFFAETRVYTDRLVRGGLLLARAFFENVSVPSSKASARFITRVATGRWLSWRATSPLEVWVVGASRDVVHHCVASSLEGLHPQ